MYKTFYNLSVKPFTLLPDPGFLYMSDQHRTAFSLLEYGVLNQAGFIVISGDIGAGKTTLIRHLLDNIDQEHTVGLISNTHRSFGELLQWILLAFNLEHADLGKVEMYQRFVDFIIDEYAHNRRTVLIVDEAQNMSVETLEELRMLSNVNADKDQALQVILVGQNELRETLQRPDLVQFAQRISVDFHLQPLPETETITYIRHRLAVAGGSPDIFSDAACKVVHRLSNGVPRLINVLCDTALVYGYAGQEETIGPDTIEEVGRDKQKTGIFPTRDPAAKQHSTSVSIPLPQLQPVAPVTTGLPTGINKGHLHPVRPLTDRKIRLALCSAEEGLRHYLDRLLESHGIDVTAAVPLDIEALEALNSASFDIFLVDRPENEIQQTHRITEFFATRNIPVLYNDSMTTEKSLRQGNPDFGTELVVRIKSLLHSSTVHSPAVNH